jgi:hypothetical protein
MLYLGYLFRSGAPTQFSGFRNPRSKMYLTHKRLNFLGLHFGRHGSKALYSKAILVVQTKSKIRTVPIGKWVEQSDGLKHDCWYMMHARDCGLHKFKQCWSRSDSMKDMHLCHNGDNQNMQMRRQQNIMDGNSNRSTGGDNKHKTRTGGRITECRVYGAF